MYPLYEQHCTLGTPDRDYPGNSLDSIMWDFGSCSVGDTRSCMQYSVVLPDGSYAKKVFIAIDHRKRGYKE